MKKTISFLSMLLLIAVMLPLTASCGSDDDDSGARDGELISQAVGSWMCVESSDTYQGYTSQGLMVGKMVYINRQGTFTSNAPSFGTKGTYTVSGNTITARNTSGDTFLVTVSVSGDRMTWNGTSSTGVTFHYVFQRTGGTGSSSTATSTYDPNTSPYGPLSLSQTSAVIGDSEGTFTVRVNTNPYAQWNIALNNSNTIDCDVTPASGRGSGIVYIKYPARKSKNGEVATIIFYYRGLGDVEQNQSLVLTRETVGY